MAKVEQPMSRWLSLGIGAAAVIVGAALTLKPYSSLRALTIFIAAAFIIPGIGEVLESRRDAGSRWSLLSGLALIATGIVAVAWPDATVRTVAIIVGLGAIGGGAARIWAAIRGSADERYVAGIGGLASLILGILALSWPDITILAVALIIGPVAVIFGIGQLLRALVGDRDWGGTGADGKPGFLARFFGWGRFARATIAIVIALLLVGISGVLNRNDAEVDAFYNAPSEMPSQVGQLIKQESFDNNIPDGSSARRILYSTTRYDGTIAVASAVVYQPKEAGNTPHPVVLWTHGTTGYAQRCAPSLNANPLGTGGIPAIGDAIKQGWVVIAPDYIGLGTKGPHPYLIGIPEAQSALDSVRAARQLDDLMLGDQTVVWGHSQGGGAALWVGIEAATYAPDVKIAGVAALAPASDLVSLAGGILNNPVGTVFATYIVKAYSEIYPDVKFSDYVQSTGVKVADEIANRCVELKTLLSASEVNAGEPLFTGSIDTGALKDRLAENIPSQPTGLPTLIGQGAADDLVLPESQTAFVEKLCAAGQVVDYRLYAGKDHVGVVAADSPLTPELIEWTAARFAGEPPPTACTTTEQ